MRNVNETNTSRKKNSSMRNAWILIVGLVIVIIILLLIRGCDTGTNPLSVETNETGPGIIYDDSAIEGGWEEADTDAIVASLNQKLEEGLINISMNTSPYFADGTSEGNLMIVNEDMNRYPQVVEIIRNDTEECIYKSGAIPVGSKIEDAKLDADLPAGTYDCTAMFYNVDPNTGSYLGCAGAIIQITVQS